jgi:hypothetical protein
MNMMVTKLKSVVKGIINGFDRIVFKGSMLPLMSAKGAMDFCCSHKIRNKDFKTWAMAQTEQVVQDAKSYAKMHGVVGIIPISTSKIRKEDFARARQAELDITSGLIGVYSCIEPCWSYKAQYSEGFGYPRLRKDWTKCKHLYFYFDHERYGFMNIRLQTWFPYHVQICLNGRQWLRRGLESLGVPFVSRDNKFFDIGDYELAQHLLDQQLDTQWHSLLDGFTSAVFPSRSVIIGPRLSYYWTLWQSEWATDFIFPSPEDIAPIMDSLLRHAFMTGVSTRVLRYMDRPLKLDGTPYSSNSNEVISKLLSYGEGMRIRHWVDSNSVKLYNELNGLRVESTINKASMFRVQRCATGHSSSPKRFLPLRQGVADITLRAQVSQQINDRFLDNLAAARCEKPVGKLLDEVVVPFKKEGRRIRALDPTGKDRTLLQAISDPAFSVSALTNKALREKLRGKSGFEKRSDKQLSAKISRLLRLLRDHGVIRKLPKRRKYVLTTKGQELTASLNALLAASTQQLIGKAA